MTDDVHPQLQETVVDRMQSSLRALTSAIDLVVPAGGSVFGELISVVLPANREQRMAVFATRLHRRLNEMGSRLETMLHDLTPEQLALLEDGLRSSARATQEERILGIADIVADGVRAEHEAARQRDVLDLLGTLSDGDVAYLARYANWKGYEEGKRLMTIGQHNALPDEEKAELAERGHANTLSKQKLLANGLLRSLLSVKESQGSGSEMVVVQGDARLSEFGEWFCRRLGIWTSGERRLFPKN